MASLEDLGLQSLCKGSHDSTGAVAASSRELWLVLLGSVLTLGLGMAYSRVMEKDRTKILLEEYAHEADEIAACAHDQHLLYETLVRQWSKVSGEPFPYVEAPEGGYLLREDLSRPRYQYMGAYEPREPRATTLPAISGGMLHALTRGAGTVLPLDMFDEETVDDLDGLTPRGLKAYIRAHKEAKRQKRNIARAAAEDLDHYPELGGLYAQVRATWPWSYVNGLLKGVKSGRDAKKILDGMLYMQSGGWNIDDGKMFAEVRKAFTTYSPTTVAALLAHHCIHGQSTVPWQPIAEKVERAISKVKSDDDRRRLAEAVMLREGRGSFDFYSKPLAPQYPALSRLDQAEIALGVSPKKLFYPVPLPIALEYADLLRFSSAGQVRRTYLVKTLERELDAFWKNDRELSSGSERGKDIACVLESLRRVGSDVDPQRAAWLLAVVKDPERLSALTLERSFPGPDGQEVKGRFIDKLYDLRDDDIPGPKASVHTVFENAAEREARFREAQEAARPAVILPRPEWWPPAHEIPGVKLLRSNRALAREGEELRHCVGGYTAAAKRGERYIASLDRPESGARTTLEISPEGEIRQNRGLRNREATYTEFRAGREVEDAVMAMRKVREQIQMSDLSANEKARALEEISSQGASVYIAPWARGDAQRDYHVRTWDKEADRRLSSQIMSSSLTLEQKEDELYKLRNIGHRTYLPPWMRGDVPKDAHVRAKTERDFYLGLGLTPEEADAPDDLPPDSAERYYYHDEDDE